MYMKPPIPSTKTALLPSEGYDGLLVTKHTFLKTIETSHQLPDGTWEDVWQFVFSCDNTGAERVWGYEPRDVLAIPTLP